MDETLSKHEERLAASCRARSRRRLYSASALLDWRWLKAEAGQWGFSAAGDGLKLTATAQLGHGIRHLRVVKTV